MGSGNINNLVSNEQRTPEQRRENAQKAGLASGIARQNNKRLREALTKVLSGKYKIDDFKDKIKGYDVMAYRIMQQAFNGNVKAFVAIRDTIGEKPTDTVELANDSLTGIQVKFVNKSNPNKHKEQDPKIVGEYTPPSNYEEG